MKCFACIRESYSPSGCPIQKGRGNGYVLVPRTHKLFGMDTEAAGNFIDLDVQRGITWADGELPGEAYDFEFITERPDNLKDYWVLGFDTSYFGDDSSLDEAWVTRKTLRLKKYLELDKFSR